MEKGLCKLKDICMFNFETIDIQCGLIFGKNTKFNFKIIDEKVILTRPQICLTIPLKRFEKYFDKI